MQNIKKAKINKTKTKSSVVILRADFNVPIVNNKVSDTFRIDAALPTIEYLVKKGAKVIILAHIGDNGKGTLKPVANYLGKKLPPKTPLIFCTDTNFDIIAKKISEMPAGSVRLLENVRRFKGEMQNDMKLAKDFSSLADIYVNDAFSVSHRAHTSIVGIPKYLPSYAGFQMLAEITNLQKVLKPKQPFLFMLGGFKFDTKLPVLKKFSKFAKNYFVGGALANNYILAEGYEVGKSLVDTDFKITKPQLNDKKLIPIVDVVVSRAGKPTVCALSEIKKTDIISDIGPATVDLLSIYIAEAKTVLWNGPMGWYEKDYTKGTKELLNILAKNVKNKKTVAIIGGGDTANLVHRYKMQNDFTFVSTGGGATLEFLAKGTLVGIKALK